MATTPSTSLIHRVSALLPRLLSPLHEPTTPGLRTPPPGYYDAPPEPTCPSTPSFLPSTPGFLPASANRLLNSLFSAPNDTAWTTDPVPPHTPSPACTCVHCFHHRELYLLWLKNQHTHHQTCTCHRPVKPLLHRVVATAVLRLFTLAFVVYPYVRMAVAGAYAWERRNRVCERVVMGVMVLVGRVLGVLDVDEVDEARVRKWVVRAGGEVVGGVVDGLRMGVGVWGGRVSVE